jgi:hypothetical protein
VAVVLQICGLFIIAAVLMQAGVALFAEASHAFRRRQMDRRRLAEFTAQTDLSIRRANASRERAELTWSGKRKFRLVQRRIENLAKDICSFYLEPHDGGALPPFLPGQFLTFELNVPDHPVPVVRCYSLSDSPLVRDHYRVSIKRLGPPPKAGPEIPPGLSSSYFHNLKEGDIVDVRAPAGGFHLDPASERPAVFIAGGIGLTPVLSMFKWLADTGSRRTAWFFLAVRNSNDIALRDEIREAADRNKQQFHTVTLYSDPTEQCVEGKDYDCKGFVSVDLLKRYLKTSNYEFYICGPPPMMEAIVKALLGWGVPEADIHFEAFGPGSVKKVQKAEPEGTAAAAGFKVELARSRRSLVWTKEAGTLLELADANGIRINSGCRAGNCGTCVTAVKNGSVSYLVKPATDPAPGSALVCIAHPTGDIVLDA